MNERPAFDLHVHSRYSPDSRSRLEEICDAAARAGLQGFALTDHNSIDGHRELAQLAARRPELVVVRGVEVSTREGHVLVYGATELPSRRPSLEEVVKWATDRNWVAVLAHPFRWGHGVGERGLARARFLAVETHNGHSRAAANRRAGDANGARGTAATGGSDAHRPEEVGRGRTRFAGPIRSEAELLDALRAGRMEAEGDSLGGIAWWGLAAATAARRLARGFRPI